MMKHVNRKAILLVVGLGIGAGLASATGASEPTQDDADFEACRQRNDDVAKEFSSRVSGYASCKVDSDCEVVPIYRCPLGCYVAVARRNSKEVKRVAKEAGAQLDRSCECKSHCQPIERLDARCKKRQCEIQSTH